MDLSLPKEPEKRYYKRLDFEIPVEVKSSSFVLATKTLNISCGGFFVQGDVSSVTKQQEVEAILELPGKNKKIQLIGSVTRIETEATKKNGFAVEFKSLYNDNVLLIDRFIKENYQQH